MLSRIADSLYWLNRYLERTDGMLRIMHTNYVLSLDKGEYGLNSWRPVLELFTHLDETEINKIESDSAATLKHLILDSDNNNSIKVIINKARENARGAQDHITKEVWEQINHLYHIINNPVIQSRINGEDGLSVLDQLMDQSILFNGVTDSTMPRNIGWSFMTMGKFVERCLITLVVADKHFQQIGYDLDTNKDVLHWRNLLLSLSGYEHHLKNYNNPNHNLNVIDQLLFNKQFTRSVTYSLDRIGFYLVKVVEQNRPESAASLLKLFGRVHSRVEYGDFDIIRQMSLKDFLHNTRNDLLHFNKLLGQIFFSYT